jgi:hypothetical protein
MVSQSASTDVEQAACWSLLASAYIEGIGRTGLEWATPTGAARLAGAGVERAKVEECRACMLEALRLLAGPPNRFAQLDAILAAGAHSEIAEYRLCGSERGLLHLVGKTAHAVAADLFERLDVAMRAAIRAPIDGLEWLRLSARLERELASVLGRVPRAPLTVTADDIARRLNVSEKAMDRYRGAWGKPLVPGNRKNGPATYLVEQILPHLRTQFPSEDLSDLGQ